MFQGKSTFLVGKGYPAVYWPGHPAANAAGIAYVHKIVAFNRWGEEALQKQVHHKNEDKTDFSVENLELLTVAEHRQAHAVPPEVVLCETCGEPVIVAVTRRKRSKRIFCSVSCSAASRVRVQWPTVAELRTALAASTAEALAASLGVSSNAIRKRLRNHA